MSILALIIIECVFMAAISVLLVLINTGREFIRGSNVIDKIALITGMVVSIVLLIIIFGLMIILPFYPELVN